MVRVPSVIVGFVGSGNMAAAMARGWMGKLESMLFTDSGSGRAAELAREVGGEAVGLNAELAKRADVIVLAVKPAKLEQVALELGAAKAIVSLLGATSLETLRRAFPEAEVGRAMPNLAVEVGCGVLCTSGSLSPDMRRALAGLGRVEDLDDAEFDAATAVMGCSPAYFALAVEALAEAGAEAGLDGELARELVVETLVGTGELLRRRDPLDVRDSVASPGGSTEAGLEALAGAGAAEAFAAAVRASLERMRG
ncbi:MAG TPA: pyrroline-5-carboxylate reductase dimerization domain-containing protein [Solirubrobacterales bacterium]|nr:pyrroline-5-carboxylate reductase dimerization domain-containing protein [Solirubrobacterales bacterium]